MLVMYRLELEQLELEGHLELEENFWLEQQAPRARAAPGAGASGSSAAGVVDKLVLPTGSCMAEDDVEEGY